MYERYTEGARRAIFLAKNEAVSDRSPAIETDHLLQGVITADIERLVSLISRASRDSIQEKVLRAKKVYHGGGTSDDPPMSGESKRALNNAEEEADHLKHEKVEIEHLLLGLMRDTKTVAGRILEEQGLKLSDLRQKLGGSPELAASAGFGSKLKKLFGR